MASDLISGGGGALASLFGSDEAPKAVLNRFAAPTAKAAGALGTDLLRDTNVLGKTALDRYLADQGRMEGLASDQEGVLRNILGRRMAADPNALLQSVGDTAFGFINPNVINPLSQFDVNSVNLMRRARGVNPAAIDSTADRLRNARIASSRYYDVARDAYQALPNLYGQAFNQNAANEAAAAGAIPAISSAYESVATRPTTGILNRINTVGAAQNVGGQGIQNILSATQGYKQPRNWADRIGAASADIGSGLSGTLGQVAGLAGSLGGGGGSL
jgi:hypothetical protein